MDESSQSILEFWYSERIKTMWFASTAELDTEIRTRFQPLWEKASQGELNHWTQTAEGTLALIILLDQFPLNMYRQMARSFETEQMAVQVVKKGLEKGMDLLLSNEQKAFFYMPLMHSENNEDQELSVQLYAKAGLESNLRFARHHQGLIKQFGRFPHRNAILNRKSSKEEMLYLDSKHAFKG